MRGECRFREETGDMVFAFSVCHLMPEFVVLLVGTILCSLLFIAELIVNCLSKRKKHYSRFRRWSNLC